jgi:hypothetical protein
MLADPVISKETAELSVAEVSDSTASFPFTFILSPWARGDIVFVLMVSTSASGETIGFCINPAEATVSRINCFKSRPPIVIVFAATAKVLAVALPRVEVVAVNARPSFFFDYASCCIFLVFKQV